MCRPAALVDATHIGKPSAIDWKVLAERITALLLDRLRFVGEHVYGVAP